MTIHLRADRVLLRFSGEDAHRLLNDVVTGRIPHEGEATAPWALLSPQGKILAEGLARHEDGALWLDVHQSVVDDFFKRMRMYKLRAKVEIEDLRATHRVGYSDADGGRVIGSLEDAAGWSSDDTAYHRARIAAGVLHQGNDFPANDAFAHDIALDLRDGIDFDKGCYVGQEVVSRMKHRGTARRRPVIVSGIDAPAGTPVVADGREAGTIGQVFDGVALASLRLDRIADPAAVTVDGKPVTLTLPGYATYQFGETAAE